MWQWISRFSTLCSTSTHSVEKWKKFSHWKKFRQINYLAIALVKPLLSLNFCQKCVRMNFRNFHSVTLWRVTTLKLHNFLCHCVLKSTFSLIYHGVNWFHEIFYIAVNFCFIRTMLFFLSSNSVKSIVSFINGNRTNV